MKIRKSKNFNCDSILLSVIITLILIGVVMVFSTSAIMAYERYENMYFFMFRQLIWVMLGTGALIVGLGVNYKTWAKLSTPALLFVILLLAMLLFPFIGHTVSGARRWIRIGGIGFQPSEMAKIVVVIYLASLLDRKQRKQGQTPFKLNGVCPHLSHLLPPLVLILIVALLIYKQPDFGTAVLIILITVGMLFLGGLKIRYIGIGMLFLIPFIIYSLFAYRYRIERVLSFLNPFENIKGSGFQLAHSIMALGDGGLSGLGIGSGFHKLFFIPEVHTDFIYAIVGQELGFIGTSGIILLFLVFTWRGIKIALKQDDYLAKIMAAGITFLISIQAIINIAVVTGCLPTKGLPLPFVSFGGSSLFFNMFAVGILLNISKGVKSRQKRVLLE